MRSRTTAAEPAIRPYREGDAAAVCALLAGAGIADPLVDPPTLHEWRTFAAMSFNREGRDFAVAETEARLDGCLVSTRLPDDRADLRHFRIFVDPGARRRGLGSRLLDLARRQDADPTTLQCNCNRSWRPGTAFLEAHGFRAVRRERLMRREGGPPAAADVEGIAVRPFGRPGDEAVWSALHDRGYRNAPDFVPLSVEDAAAWRDGSGFRLLFAERLGTAVGFCHWTQPADGKARIESLVVDPELRGRGIGWALLATALRELAEAGHAPVGLGVRDDNAPAIRLYERLGFRPVDEMITWHLRRG